MSRVRSSSLALLVAFLLVAAALVAPAASPARAQDATPPADSSSPAIAVVRRVASAVVTVINEQTSTGPNASMQVQPAGSGTGFIIDRQGHIVTNWHVVQGGEKFQVVFSDGKRRDAKLVGSDEVSDVAVVQVTGDVPGIVAFGDSSLLEPGQTVLAIGSPLGAFTNTVTEGIVSAVGRHFPTSQNQGPQIYDNLIQHDAAINPGNSGGPLLNLAGEVVGVNTLGIPTDAQGQPVQGLFFAIPANAVKQITGRLIADGKVVYPFFGISSVPVTQDVAAQAGLTATHGVYVAEVTAGGPAEAAGIKVGDVILAIDGQTVDEQHSFVEVLFLHKPGDAVKADIQHGDKTSTVSVTLGERPAQS